MLALQILMVAFKLRALLIAAVQRDRCLPRLRDLHRYQTGSAKAQSTSHQPQGSSKAFPWPKQPFIRGKDDAHDPSWVSFQLSFPPPGSFTLHFCAVLEACHSTVTYQCSRCPFPGFGFHCERLCLSESVPGAASACQVEILALLDT